MAKQKTITIEEAQEIIQNVSTSTIFEYAKLPDILKEKLENGEFVGYEKDEDGNYIKDSDDKNIPIYKPLKVEDIIKIGTFMRTMMAMPNSYSQTKTSIKEEKTVHFSNRLPEDLKKLIDAS